MRIVQEFGLRRVINPKAEVKLIFIPFSHPQTCYYHVQGYFFKIEECDSLSLGRGITVFGTGDTNLDTGFLSQKRLMNVKIMQECGKSDSVLCWFSIILPPLLALKSHFLKTTIGYLPTASAQLSLSMLFGDQTLLSKSQSLLFELTGTQHLIAASGYNVGLVSTIVSRLVHQWKRTNKLLALLVSIWIYALWTGFGASIVRAALMHTLALTALVHHRLYTPLWGLLLSVFIMLLVYPWYLGDVGFQLSVSATASILIGLRTNARTSAWKSWVSGELYFQQAQLQPSHFSWMSGVKSYLTDSIKVGFLAQIGTFPLVLYHFGEASLWSIVATSLVAWLIPFIMIGTTLVGLLAVLVEISRLVVLVPLVQFLGFFLWVFTSSCLWLLAVFNYLPRWTLSLPQVSVGAVTGWWMGNYAWSRWYYRRQRP